MEVIFDDLSLKKDREKREWKLNIGKEREWKLNIGKELNLWIKGTGTGTVAPTFCNLNLVEDATELYSSLDSKSRLELLSALLSYDPSSPNLTT
ncbi:hypothetical protein HN51_010710 [Arachis hypogaea]